MPFNSGHPCKKPKLSDNNNYRNFLDDSDDELILLASQQVEGEQMQPPPPPLASQVDFQDFRTNLGNGSKTSTQNAFNVNVQLNSKLSLNTSRVSESYLKKKIETLEKELQDKGKELEMAIEKLKVKEYEITTANYELKQCQKTTSDLRIKLMKHDRNSVDVNRVHELEKKVDQLKSELQLKSLEMVKLRSSRKSETSPVASSSNLGSNYKRFLINVPCVELQGTKEEFQLPFSNRALEPWEVKRGSDSICKEQFTKLQFAVAQIMSPGHKTEEGFLQSFFALTMDCCKMLSRFVSNNKPNHSNLNSIYKVRTLTLDEEKSIYDKEKMYPAERSPVIRRLIALIALACQSSSKVRKMITDFHPDFLSPVISLITNLGFSNNLYEHIGIIRATTVFLNSLNPETEDQQKSYFNLFRALVFSCPDLWSLGVLCKVMAKMSNHKWFNKKLCQNSSKECFAYSVGDNAIYFTDDSCTLQVFAATVKMSISITEEFNRYSFKQLLEMTKNIIRFYRNCIAMRENWLIAPLEASSTEGQRQCECYSKISSCTCIFLHMCLKMFMAKKGGFEKEYKRRVITVAQLGVLVLNDILQVNLQLMFAIKMGRKVKTRFIDIFNLLNEFNNLYHFRLTQAKALEHFKSDIILPPVMETDLNYEHDELSDEMWNTLEL